MKTYLSVGCSCSFNITYGFELMLNPESSKNLFRILQCRDLNHFKLQAILFDNACNFNAYLLNREPRMYEYLRCLIDISHFHGHKKRKLNSNTRMGHLGCSSSFNAANYKEHFSRSFNSQGREQFHSLLEKVSSSFTQMNYTSYMILLRVFCIMRNLKNKNII